MVKPIQKESIQKLAKNNFNKCALRIFQKFIFFLFVIVLLNKKSPAPKNINIVRKMKCTVKLKYRRKKYIICLQNVNANTRLYRRSEPMFSIDNIESLSSYTHIYGDCARDAAWLYSSKIQFKLVIYSCFKLWLPYRTS
jgi:hypothetical protein